MKTLVGIDLAGYWRKALPLLKGIGFEGNQPVFLNAVESVLPDGGFVTLPDTHPIQQMLSENEAEGRKQGEEAVTSFGGGEVVVEYGDATAKLLHNAERLDADLVAVGSEQKGTLGSLFFGSVAQAMLTGSKCSVLFGKKAPDEGPLTAVFATDHSDYANRALEWLIAHKPTGIDKLIIMTAATVNPLVGDHLVQHVENLDEKIIDVILKSIQEQSESVAARFRELRIETLTEVRQKHPSHAIDDAMKEHEGDLLIIGAQGHGFIDRLRIGSTSFEKVVNSPHNVLVIRPD